MFTLYPLKKKTTPDPAAVKNHVNKVPKSVLSFTRNDYVMERNQASNENLLEQRANSLRSLWFEWKKHKRILKSNRSIQNRQI